MISNLVSKLNVKATLSQDVLKPDAKTILSQENLKLDVKILAKHMVEQIQGKGLLGGSKKRPRRRPTTGEPDQLNQRLRGSNHNARLMTLSGADET